MIVLLILFLALQSKKTFLATPFDLGSWKFWVGIVSIVVYGFIVPIFSKEFFVLQISEEDFYSILCNYLKDNYIIYKANTTNGIPISEEDSIMTWYYIHSSKTGYVKSKKLDHYTKAKAYFSKRIHVCETRYSYQRYLFLVLSIFILIIGLVKIFQLTF
ncbi:MAG: hypothetical protein KAH01_08040 [Caldisericia bacterium]|nr:hypothetical protein [Caldisericia bacterium]